VSDQPLKVPDENLWQDSKHFILILIKFITMKNLEKSLTTCASEVSTLRDAVGVMEYSAWVLRMDKLHKKLIKMKNHLEETKTSRTLNERTSRTRVQGNDRIAQSFNLFKKMIE